MYYENYYFGINLIWWGLGIILLFFIFLIPFDTTKQRRKKESTYNLLQKQFIVGEITESNYNEKKKNLQEKYHKS
jgi:putative membrane protein